jgi:DNA-directed RNA polymerase subunit alpha
MAIAIVQPKMKFERVTDTSARFVVEPLERGFGHVLGNSFRRVLLASIPGSAVTSVKIDGVLHEFSTIPGVKEDVTDIILNVKQLVLKSYSELPVTVKIEAKGAKEIKAGDIITTADVEIIDEALPIATLNKQGKLEAELTVEQGKGYVAAERNKKEKMPIGTIPVDSIFSPVRNVTYEVGKTRVGQITDYDKLTLSVETDGSIEPTEALMLAAQIVADHMALFENLTEDIAIGVGFPSEVAGPSTDLEMSIDDLDLSTRSYNCLKREKIDTVEKLANCTEADLNAIKNFGKRSVTEVKEKLGELGLTLREED